ncbi:MAG: hypothetical protein IPP20_19475 [Gemmatimonadetes bacterium]|nr:hypothetical protein [Gemmatimonadota bacterium]
MRRLTFLLGLVLGLLPVALHAQRTDNPHGLSVQGTCSACHKAEGWKPAVIAPGFEHAPKTFPLEGAHTKATCKSCHVSLDFSEAPATCASCHQDVHKGEFGTQCARCHTARTFNDRAQMAQVHQTGRFPLRGGHATVSCESCHTPARNGQLQFVNRPATCIGCHAATMRAVKSPDHQAAAFSQNCSSCHTLISWDNATFDHSKTRFPLTLGHAGRTCASCHADKVYHDKPMACVSCHTKDYQRALNPPHSSGFPTLCADCHTTAEWKGAKFDHDLTQFPLLGAHKATTCAECHADKVFKGKPASCISCHQSDFQETTTPKHPAAGFSESCLTCHTMTGWKGAKFDHNTTRFALAGKHATAVCQSCHADFVYKGKSQACVSCHRPAYDATSAPPHAAAGFTTLCESCHKNAVAWLGAPFDHNKTRFALTGGHKAATCLDCHNDKVYVGKSMACASCHQAKYDATTNPPHLKTGFSKTCSNCHGTQQWAGAAFDHTTTGFQLTNGHSNRVCNDCHSDGVFKGRSKQCVSCHQTDFSATTTPPHAASGFPSTCETCHSTIKWTGGVFNHSTTRFPLTGKHIVATCNNCHADGVYKGKPTTCLSCHQSDFTQSKNPPHASSGFPGTCETCHTTSTWLGAAFDHNATAFALTGAHKTAICADCHRNGVFKGTPTTCVGCHQTDYSASKNPPHAASGFSTVCASCHTTATWTGGKFDHNTTSFPINGGHLTASCNDCHADGVYNGKPTTCVSCHLADYNGALTPPHKSAGLPTTCQTCHNNVSWKGGAFDHSKTLFPLTGAHLATTCAGCHADNVFKGKPTACASCHQTEFNAATNPHHAAAGFTTLCASCHTTAQWPGAPYNHNTQTSFPLAGKHLAAKCIDCHADKVYNNKPTTCVSCHQTDYNNTTNPKHSTSGFGTTCQTCHTNANSWLGAVFNHNNTLFPLTGSHLTATCLDCHSDGVYKGKPTACASCHQSEYNTATNPHHAAAGFNTLCASCHTTTQWPGAPYNHSATSFPLAGKHLAAKCIDCHSDKVYNNKPTTCVSCHQTDYNNTTNPKHSTSGFGTTCQTCHTNANSWLGAVFNHNNTLFPLTGAHLTATCLDCHSDGVYKGQPTACASCPQTDFNTATNPHHAAAGFNTLCATCHTTTQWPGAPYNHSATSFPLAGKHLAAKCIDCHSDRVYNNKPTTCVSCHQTDYNNTTNPKHSTSGFGTTCQTCHTNANSWLGAVFNHNNTLFPLTGSHLTATCLDCHSDGVYKGKPTACASCHQAVYNNSTNPHHAAAGFTTLCATCHTTTQWPGAPYNHTTQTSFPLSGKHLTARCIDCHADRVYNNKPTTCVSCHQTDYNNTTNPKHSTAGFPTTCQTCHTGYNTWLGATFNHDGPYFPIYSGKHKGEWNTCADCHQQPSNYKQFECILCHEHSNKTKVDNDHRGENGYQYNSAKCYSCHPRGN